MVLIVADESVSVFVVFRGLGYRGLMWFLGGFWGGGENGENVHKNVVFIPNFEPPYSPHPPNLGGGVNIAVFLYI